MFKSRMNGRSFFGKCFPTGQYDGGGTWYSMTQAAMRGEAEVLLRNHWNSAKLKQTLGPYPLSSTETFYSTEFKRPQWNDCSHIKSSYTYSLPISFVTWGGQTSGCINHMQHYGWTTQGPLTNPQVDEPSDFTRARAWATMMPRFESDFQALNFIFELKDWKHLGKPLANALTGKTQLTLSLSNLDKAMAKKGYDVLPSNDYRRRRSLAPKSASRGRGRDLSCAEAFDGGANSFAEAWLFNSYAIQPTLRDIAALRAALATEYLDALGKFKESGTKPNSRHYSELLRDNSSEIKYTNLLTGGLERRLDYSKFSASLQYQYKYKLDDNAEAFRRYWGLTGTAEEFWNMLPFSFLLDYFFTVAKSLKLSERDKNLDLAVVQYCESVLSLKGQAAGFTTTNTSSDCGYIIDGQYYGSDGRFRPFMGSHNSIFTRKLCEPMKYGLVLPQWKLPSLNQSYNIGALVKLLLF